MLRYLTAGESHGKGLVVIVEGLPAGLPIVVEEVQGELARRRLGYGRGPGDALRTRRGHLARRCSTRPHARLAGGHRDRQHRVGSLRQVARRDVTCAGQDQEPGHPAASGHADLAGMQKYGFDDARDVLERASARETAARVAAGTLAKALLSHLGVSVLSHVIQMGPVRTTSTLRPGPGDLTTVDENEVRCFDASATAAMVDEIKACAKDGDSLGGIVEILAYGVPVGLGSHVHWDRKIDSLLAQALMSIQAVKGVEVGDGFEVAGRRGSSAHDPITWNETDGYVRESTLAGGVEGGMTTGELVVARAAMKPLASLNKPVLKTVDVRTKEETVSFKERTDVTAVPAMGVVAETMVSLVLANEALRKFGGDSLDEFKRNHDGFVAGL